MARRGGGNSALLSLWADPLDTFINPFSLLRRLQNELGQAFTPGGNTTSMSGRGRNQAQPGADDINTVVWVPAIEVAMQDNNFVLSAELPGVSDEDISVQVTDDAVVIQGERQVEREDDRGRIRRTERAYGQFYRVIPLPDGADPEQAKAEIDNGVLRVTVPISQARSNTREIPVQAGASSSGTRGGTQSGTQSGKGTRTDADKEKAA
jgi:HSP20 family protein